MKKIIWKHGKNIEVEVKDASDAQRKFIKSLLNEITRLDPGYVTTMYSLLISGPVFTSEEASTVIQELLRTKESLKKKLIRNVEK